MPRALNDDLNRRHDRSSATLPSGHPSSRTFKRPAILEKGFLFVALWFGLFYAVLMR